MMLSRSPKALKPCAGRLDVAIKGWETDVSQIEICKFSDGSDWLLGEGAREEPPLHPAGVDKPLVLPVPSALHRSCFV